MQKKSDQPNKAESPSSASSSFFSSFFSSSLDGGVPAGAEVVPALGVEEGVIPIGAAFKASSMFTSLSAAISAFTRTSSGVEPVAFRTFFTLSSVMSRFNLCKSNEHTDIPLSEDGGTHP